MRWITHAGEIAAQGKPDVAVWVKTTLTGLESAQLDQWVAAHLDDLDVVEVQQHCVCVHGRHPYLTATAIATATRHPGLLTEALDDALHRLRTEGGGS